MQKRMTALALAWLGVLSLAAGAPGTGLADDIRRTTDPLLQGGSGAPADVQAALRRVLEIAAGLGREARVSAAVQAKLDAASAAARPPSPPDESLRASVADAYAALDEGRAFVLPEAVGSMDEAKERARGQVDRAVASVSARQPQAAARELLGFVLLVITPFEGRS